MSKSWHVEWNPTPSDIPQISDLRAEPGYTNATIVWQTQIAADSTVYYGLTTNYGSSATGNSNITHSVTLTNLNTNTLYYYYVTSTSGTNTGESVGNTFVTLGAPPNNNAIIFVSTSQSITGQISFNASATITWIWGDGTTNTSSSHTFTTAGTYINYLIVNPASALTGFGVACQTSSVNTLSSVSGLSNYPNLQGLFFYESGLSQVSLAGCSNLVYIALVGTQPSSTNENQWFNDLSAAEPNVMPPGDTTFCGDPVHHFFFPLNPGTNSTSATACSNLVNIGWILEGH